MKVYNARVHTQPPNFWGDPILFFIVKKKQKKTEKMIPCEKFFVQLFILISANFKIKQRGRIKVKGKEWGKSQKKEAGEKQDKK